MKFCVNRDVRSRTRRTSLKKAPFSFKWTVLDKNQVVLLSEVFLSGRYPAGKVLKKACSKKIGLIKKKKKKKSEGCGFFHALFCFVLCWRCISL